MMNINPLLLTDSYKVTHWPQYPEKTTKVYSYWESRGGRFPELVPFGLQYYLMEYFSKPITKEDVDYAESRFTAHFGTNKIFNRDGWMHIVNKHGGYLPLIIKSVPEGMPVPTRNVMMTMENTDDKCWWLTNYMETLLSMLWYPTTVATLSREIKKVILKYLVETGDPLTIQFKLHDFGFRGVSSVESSGIGGCAHLVNFMGTDTMSALEVAKHYYGEDMAGFSVPAAEHSTITSWGQEKEADAFQNMIKTFDNMSVFAIAVVSDSYNIYHAVKELWGKQLYNDVMNMTHKLVVRPDSGTPHEVVRQVVEDLDKSFGHTVNDKGFKVLNKVGVIQGDGIDYDEIVAILEALKIRGWSADNVLFGMGGALLQKMDRDTQKFAIKCSSAIVDGRQRDVYKSPVTDNGKRSKSGRLKLVNADGYLNTVNNTDFGQDLLEPVYKNGAILKSTTLKEIRALADVVITSDVTTW